MKKETTKKSKLWIWIVVAAVLLLAAGGTALALLGGGNQGSDATVATDPIPTGPRADLYWNLDREFYTANSQTGLSTREADADGKFKMKFAYNGEIVELEIIDKKLVNIIDTQDIVGLTFDENGVVIGQINVRELATEVGKKVYVKKATDDMIQANSSMAMNGMELNLKLGQYSEIYDLREGSETYGKKIAPSDLGVMDCMTVYANADGDNTHFFILQAAQRSKIYWRANLWTSAANNKAGFTVDENGYTILPFYADGEYVEVKTNDAALVEYYAGRGRHNGFTGLIFDENGYAIDVLNAAVGVAGQQLAYALDITEINGNYIKAKNNISTSGVMNWEGEIPDTAAIYAMGSWAYSEGIMGKKLAVSDLQVNDRITIFADMEGNIIEIGVTNRIYDLKPMYNNNQKYDPNTRSTTRVKDEEGYWTFTFISDKGVNKYKTKDQKLANFIDSYPEKTFGIVTKGDKLVKAYEYENLFGQVRFSTALYVDSINSTIISCTDQRKANAYTGILAEDVKVQDISGDSKTWGQKIELQVGDCMVSFKNIKQEICQIYVTKRAMGGKLYVNVAPNTSRALIEVKNEETGEVTERYWEYLVTDMNGKQVTLKLPSGKYDEKTSSYANKYLQSRIDSATQGVIALEVSGGKIKDAHAPGNMASGNTVGTVIITKAGTTEFEYKTAATAEATVYPGWTGSEGVKMINLSGDYKSHKGEKLSGKMKVGDVYYMVRNRPNETVALFLTSRGFHNNLFFLKDHYTVVNGATTRPVNADGFYVFNVMYAGKPATVKTQDVAIATAMEGYRTGAALKLDKAAGNVVLAANDYKGTNDAYSSAVSNWDVTKISGKKITVTLNIPTTSTEVGEKKEIDITGAKIYNISPDAGDDFGKTTSLKKNDRVRIFTDKNGKVSYVLVTVREGLRVAECEHCGKKVTWNPLTATSGMGTGSAHYYVFADWSVSGQLSVSGDNTNTYDVVVDLNGKTISNKANLARTFMVAYPNKSLTLMDSVGTGRVESYGYNGNAGLIQVSYNATLNILGGTYELLAAQEGMTAPKQGGVIFSYSDKNYDRNTVNIYGGTIIGNATVYPGDGKYSTGTIATYKTDVTMYGGVITGGIADRGGNLNLASESTFVMKGGEISNGTASNRGGNIFTDSSSTVTIEGGKIFGGTTTGQMGGNIYGHTVVVTGGEIYDGNAKTTGGNIFLLGSNNSLIVAGGKIYNGTAATSGGNVYIYGGEGAMAITGGEVTGGTAPSGQNIFLGGDGSTPVKPSAMYLSAGTVSGGIYAAAECAILVEGEAKVGTEAGGIRLAKGAAILAGELAETASLPVTANGAFAKAAEGTTVDVETYMNKQIVAAAAGTTLSVETIEGEKWLVANVEEVVEPETPDTATIPEAAIKMTTDGVFNAGGIITADCPACGTKNATWMPLTATMNKLDETEHTHFYLPSDIERSDNSRYQIGGNKEICIHLNGHTYDQKATSAVEGAIKVLNGATLNIMGNGKVIGAGGYYSASAWVMGGAIDVRGTANIYGGTYQSSHNRATIATFSGSANIVVNMYAGTIMPSTSATSNPTGFWGSVVMNSATHTFNLYGGEIVGAEGATAGDVKINNGIFNVNGGTVGRMFANKNAKVNINNGANIGELDIKAGATVTLANDLAEGTLVYITDGAGEGKGLTVANDKAADYANTFIKAAGEGNVVMVNADKQLYVVSQKALMENLNAALATATTEVNAVCPVCGVEAKWVPLTAEMSALDTGSDFHYYLAENITRTDKGRFRTTVDGTTVCIHLNGKTYDQGTGESAQGAIQARAKTTINILDVADNSGTVIGAGLYYKDASLGELYGGGAIDARGTVNIYGGTFMSSRADRPAVAIFGTAGSAQVINMYGGKIVRNEAVVTTTDSEFSSLVRLHAATQQFNMYGGEITGGMAKQGGNIRLQAGTFNLYGGTIQNGTAANLGGNINIRNNGTLNVIGGEIKGGTCASSGGSIGLVSGTVNVEGGVISGGTGVTGGLIYVYAGTLNITGGELKDGVGAGGNIYLSYNKDITVNCTITGGAITGGMTKAENGEARDITVAGGRKLTLGAATIGSKVYASGEVVVKNGAKATVELTGNGKITLSGVKTGTEITVIAAETRTITTIENAADYVGFFKTNIEGATIGVKADTTNEIEIVIPVVEEPAPQA